MKNFIEPENIVGKDGVATQTTVDLFNSALRGNRDQNGEYLMVAVSAYKNGVIVEKQYI